MLIAIYQGGEMNNMDAYLLLIITSFNKILTVRLPSLTKIAMLRFILDHSPNLPILLHGSIEMQIVDI